MHAICGMAAIDDISTYWTAEIAKLSDTLRKAEATYTLSRYVAALQSAASMESTDIESYNISQRGMVRRRISDMHAAIARLRLELYRGVYGSISLADLSTDTQEPS